MRLFWYGCELSDGSIYVEINGNITRATSNAGSSAGTSSVMHALARTCRPTYTHIVYMALTVVADPRAHSAAAAAAVSTSVAAEEEHAYVILWLVDTLNTTRDFLTVTWCTQKPTGP